MQKGKKENILNTNYQQPTSYRRSVFVRVNDFLKEYEKSVKDAYKIPMIFLTAVLIIYVAVFFAYRINFMAVNNDSKDESKTSLFSTIAMEMHPDRFDDGIFKEIVKDTEVIEQDELFSKQGNSSLKNYMVVFFKSIAPHFVLYASGFGLASITMYMLLCFGLGLENKMSEVLSIIYSFSSIVLLFAQNREIMGIVVVLPLLILGIYNYVSQITVFSMVLCGMILAILFSLGPCCIVFGIPFFLIMVLFLAMYKYDKVVAIRNLVLFSIPSLIIGIIVPLIRIRNIFHNLRFCTVLKDSFKSPALRFTFFDLIYKLKALTLINPIGVDNDDAPINNIFVKGMLGNNAKDININNVPTLYFTIFALLLVILFYFNRKIKVQLKIMTIIVIFMYYLSYALVPFDNFFNVFDIGSIMGQVKFVFLIAFLLVIAGISIMNFQYLKKSDIHVAVFGLILYNTISFAIVDGAIMSGSFIITNAVLPMLYDLIFILMHSERLLGFWGKFILLLIMLGTVYTVMNSSVPEKYVLYPDYDENVLYLQDDSMENTVFQDTDMIQNEEENLNIYDKISSEN